MMERVSSGTRYCTLNCYFDFYSSKVEKGCWEWSGVKNQYGYGRMVRGRRNVISAHRFAYRRYVGKVPRALHVLHTCDNPGCVRPDHLFLGTDADNAWDKVAKGRARSGCCAGEKNGCAKLTEKIVLKLRKEKGKRADICAKYGIAIGTLAKIRNRSSWKHI